MRSPRMLCIGLSLVVGGCGQLGSPTYALKPVVGTGPNNYHMVNLGKDGEGEMPFTTASGKLRLRKTGNKILVCCNNDGKFDEISKRGENGQSTAKIPVKLAGKAFEYPLSLLPIEGKPSDEHNQLLYVMGNIHVEAQVGQTVLRLYDTNLNGRFGDPEDMLQIGPAGSVRAVTKYVEMGGRIQEFQVVNDGEAVKLLPYIGPTATLKLNAKEGWNTQVQLNHTEGLYVAFAKSTDALLLPGAYRVANGQAQFGDKKTENGRDQYPIYFYSSGSKEASIQIKEGQNSLAFGPPFRFDFAASRSAADAASVTVTDTFLIGAGGEQYRANNYGSNRGSTLTCFVRSAGKELKVADLSYG